MSSRNDSFKEATAFVVRYSCHHTDMKQNHRAAEFHYQRLPVPELWLVSHLILFELVEKVDKNGRIFFRRSRQLDLMLLGKLSNCQPLII